DHLGAAITTIDKLDKTPPDAVRTELTRKGVPEAAVEEMLALHARPRADLLTEVEMRVKAAGAPLAAQLREVLKLTSLPPAARIVFDPFLARGLDYYTGPVLEIVGAGETFSLGGGGRYDDLVERFAGVRVPACGFAIGFERVYTLMDERGMFTTTARAADVLVAVPSAAAAGEALRIAADLRAAGLRVDGYPSAGKLGPQFELAERKGIPFAVVADPEKLRTGTFEVRDLAARQSTAVPRPELSTWLRTRLASLLN